MSTPGLCCKIGENEGVNGNLMAAQSSPFSLPASAPRWRPLAPVKAASPSVDYRTWFKRIALAGWLIYAICIILLPFWDEAKERNLALDRASTSYQACKAVAVERGVSESQIECDNVYRARTERDEETYRFGSEYQSMGWHVAWVVPTAVFVPPMLFFGFVYGAIFGVRKMANWLGRGVQE